MPEALKPTITLTIPPAIAEEWARIMRESGDDLPTLLSKAFWLYATAYAERRKGLAVGSSRTADGMELEFTGF